MENTPPLRAIGLRPILFVVQVISNISKHVSEQLDKHESDPTKFECLKSLTDEFHKLEEPDLEQTEEDKTVQVELNSMKEEMKKLENKTKGRKRRP